MRINFRRWSVFNVVGLGGFVVQVSTIACLTRLFDWPSFGATAVALELAALVNFAGHSRWTWGDRPEDSVRGLVRRYWRYQAAKTASLLANLTITTVLTYAGIVPELANIAAVLACAIPNYLISEHLIFSLRRPS